MISYICGELAAIEEGKAVIDVGGIGYGVYMPEKALGLLPPKGQKVKLHTYLNVKEDCMQLFGFLTKDDLQVFQLVISVNGIGPRGGLAVLSELTPDQLRFAVMSGDVKAICAAQGIGKKTAEKLILELRDKLRMEDVLEHMTGSEGASSVQDSAGALGEAVQALVALGYGNAEALKAVKQVALTEYTDTEAILKQALKFMVL